jgi:hypothetical protein
MQMLSEAADVVFVMDLEVGYAIQLLDMAGGAAGVDVKFIVTGVSPVTAVEA